MSDAPEMVNVGSRLTMDLQISSDPPYVVRGVSHPSTDGIAVSRLPADVVKRFFEENAATVMVSGQQIFLLPDDFDATPQSKEFGHELALQRATEDAAHAEAAVVQIENPEEEARRLAGKAVLMPRDLPPPPREERRPPASAAAIGALGQVSTDPVVRQAPAATVAPPMDNPRQDLVISGEASPVAGANPGPAPQAGASPDAGTPASVQTPTQPA